MLIKVDKDNVKIVEKPVLHKGEYGVHKCYFGFSEEYNNLIKIAVFKYEYQTYKVDIINNVCDIPSEVLNRAGEVIIGVYGYASENENLLLRYSPIADMFSVGKGSYTEDGKTPVQVTPSQYEMYSQKLNEGLDEAKASSDYTRAVGDQLLNDKENGVFNGNDYEITEKDYEEIEEQIKTDIQPLLNDIKGTTEDALEISRNAENIAKGKSSSVVKDTWVEMEQWLKDVANKGTHKIGDNLYIKQVWIDEEKSIRQPDYWITEVLQEPNELGYYYNISVLGTEHPDLTDFLEKDEIKEKYLLITYEDKTTETVKLVVYK